MTFLEVLIKSKEIRKIVVERSFMYRIPLKFICRECGFEYDHFMSAYINSKQGDSFYPTELQFEKMLKLLGIKIRHQVVVDKSVDMVEIAKRLEDKYDKKVTLKLNEEEGSSASTE